MIIAAYVVASWLGSNALGLLFTWSLGNSVRGFSLAMMAVFWLMMWALDPMITCSIC